MIQTTSSKGDQDATAVTLLQHHFGRLVPHGLAIAKRTFPFRVRADLQHAIERVVSEGNSITHFSGVHKPYAHEGLDFATLLVKSDNYPPMVVPPQYEDVDVGEGHPVRCLTVGLWLGAHEDSRAALGQATKKGLLFYGPPGTGKSHTIHYLAGALPGHTTLLITAEQVAMLDEYMALARLLQPSIVVIEDVDLIARDREHMHGPCEESLLNKLLNEMDGLRESADVLFILTTNRPKALEAALASRPGRVDQAIEFPLPDAEGRAKLVSLYAGRAHLPDALVSAIVERTEHVSAAFIRELMRRAVQFHVERDGDGALELRDVEDALDEMLFSGGTLNARLLGADRAEQPSTG